MAHIQIQKTTTENIRLTPPMFWKDPKWNEWVALLDDSTVVKIWMSKNRVTIENGNTEVMQINLKDAVTNFKEIKESEFFAAFDEAYESMRLSPEIRQNAGEYREREEKELIPLENNVS